LSLIYVNPLWLRPAIVGGAIMGLGFIIGGYCPGTSVAAASIGKVDAMFFIFGGIAGVFGFGEIYSRVATFCEANAAGAVKIYDSLGISSGLFAGLLTVVAIGMFSVTTIIERRVAKTEAPSQAFSARNHRIAAAGALILAIILLILPDRQARLIGAAQRESLTNPKIEQISPDELAFWIINDEPDFKIIDLRSADAFKTQALPNSANTALSDIFSRDAHSLYGRRDLRKVLLAESESEEYVAYLLMKELGFENLTILKGGFPGFQSDILQFAGSTAQQDRWEVDVTRFRLEARAEILRRIELARQTPVAPVKKAKAVKGGC